jgi:hypothetical protein
MSNTAMQPRGLNLPDQLPTELLALRERIRDQPTHVRSELEPLLDEVLEHTVFRNRVMLIAKEALQRFRLDLAELQFELDVTKRERGTGSL